MSTNTEEWAGLWEVEVAPQSSNGTKPHAPAASAGVMPIAAPDDLGRLVFLIAEHRIRLPRGLASCLPFGNELAKLHAGLGAAGSIAELSPLYRSGATLGKGSIKEAQGILSRLLDGREFSDPYQRLQAFTDVAKLGDGSLSEFSPITRIDLSPEGVADLQDIPKFDSGFTPLDMATGGLYQGLFIIMGTPGTGKTSILLTVMEELVKQGMPVWFYETEIPGPLMQARVAPIIRRGVPFLTSDSRITCGPVTVDDILEEVKADPNPDRVIMFDGPDAQFNLSTTGERRFDLELIYQKLILIKHQSKLVMASSQPRRSDRELSLQSPAEAWAKAWWADAMLGIQRQSMETLSIKTLKNRFGPSEQRQFFSYDYKNLTWSQEGTDLDEWVKGEDW